MTRHLKPAMEKPDKLFTTTELEQMIEDNISYWSDRLEGRPSSDLQAEAANVLPQNQLAIAKHLLYLLRQADG